MLRPLYLALLFSSAAVPPVFGQQPTVTVTLVERAPSAIGEHTTAHPVVFRVANVSADDQTVRFACESAGRVVSCSVSPPHTNLQAGQAADVTVKLGTGVSGGGSVTLTATTRHGVSVAGTAKVDVAAPTVVDVSPDGDVVPAAAGSRGVLEFTVTNVGTRRAMVVLACDGQGGSAV